jgi:acyl dehydratase
MPDGSPPRPIDASLVGFELPEMRWAWDERQTMLYALGVGATVASGLRYVYEGDDGPQVLPTFGVIPSTLFLDVTLKAIDIDLRTLLHAGQSLEILRPIPARGEVQTTRRVTSVWDKGKAAVIEWESVSRDAAGPLVRSVSTSFHHGAGGFGGERGPSAGANGRPDREPDQKLTEPTFAEQPALYRLSGDRNPIHIDPAFARRSGYERPFMHGLCTYGIVGRSLLQALCQGDATRLRSIEARFSGIVEPGDTLRIDIWSKEPGEASFEVATERGPALTQGRARWSLPDPSRH